MKRIISAIILIILAVLAVIPGGLVTGIGCCLVSLLGMFEFYRAFGMEKREIGVAGYASAILYYVLLFTGKSHWLDAWLALTVIVMLVILVLRYEKYTIEQIFAGIFGVCYIAFLLSHLYLLRIMENGMFLLGLVFIASCGCDIGAYHIGSIMGKHKLAPKLSPKKSVEGAIGGVVYTLVMALIYSLIFRNALPLLPYPVLTTCVICVGASVISQFGDLAASAVKRQKGVKDYGNLIPGHGGMMDRLDSILVVGTVIYYVLRFFTNVL